MDHACPSLQNVPPVQVMVGPRSTDLVFEMRHAPPGSSADVAAKFNRINAMRIKKVAVGELSTIGADDDSGRVYAMVQSGDGQWAPTPFVFDRQWTIGRCVQSVIKVLKLSHDERKDPVSG